MIEISISRELATAHPGFISGCVKRGHQVHMFDNDGHAQDHQKAGGATDLARDDDAGASTAIDRRAATSQPA